MPDEKHKPTAAERAEATYRHGQRRAPAVPLKWHPERGEIPGVPTFNGAYTAEQTAQYLTHAQYEAALRDGIATEIVPAKAAPAPKPAPTPEKEKEA